MSDLPATFANAIEEAELNAFAILCAATGMVSGRNAFVGDYGGKVNVMSFGMTDSFRNDAAFWAIHAHPQLPFNAEATGVFRTRREVFAWMLRVVEALPIQAATGSLLLFRVESIGKIQGAYEKTTDGKSQLVGWGITITFNTVCATGGKTQS